MQWEVHVLSVSPNEIYQYSSTVGGGGVTYRVLGEIRSLFIHSASISLLVVSKVLSGVVNSWYCTNLRNNRRLKPVKKTTLQRSLPYCWCMIFLNYRRDSNPPVLARNLPFSGIVSVLPFSLQNLPFLGIISVLPFSLQNLPFFVFFEKESNLLYLFSEIE